MTLELRGGGSRPSGAFGVNCMVGGRTRRGGCETWGMESEPTKIFAVRTAILRRVTRAVLRRCAPLVALVGHLREAC